LSRRKEFAVHDLAVASAKILDARRLVLGVGADRIERVLRGYGRLLAVADMAQGGDSSRSFAARSKSVSLAASRIAASRSRMRAVYPSFQEGYDVGDDLVVFLPGHRPMHGATERPMW
jgi:hypothetical protein